MPNEPVTTTVWDYAEKKREEHPRVIQPTLGRDHTWFNNVAAQVSTAAR